MDVKPASTRKLRRRPNDPIPVPEKRRKTSPAQLNVLLGDEDILEDLRILNKISGKPLSKKLASSIHHGAAPVQPSSSLGMSPFHSTDHDHHHQHVCEARIEDGRLCYEKKW